MVEEETRLRMASLQAGRRLPAHMAENVPRTSCFHDGDIVTAHQLIEWGGRLGVPGVGQDFVADLDSVAAGPAGAVVELDRLVFIPGRRTGRLCFVVADVETTAHRSLPVDPPAHLDECLQPGFDALGSNEGDWSLVDEDPVQNEWRQSESVIAMEVGEEDGVDRARVHAAAMHVWKQRRAAVEEKAPVHHHRAVVSLW